MSEDIFRKAIVDYLDGNYPHPRSHRPGKCKHGAYYYEACENCIDEHFAKALAEGSAIRKETER